MYILFLYSLFHKTLPRSNIQIDWISVRIYEMGDTWKLISKKGIITPRKSCVIKDKNKKKEKLGKTFLW